MVRRLMKSAPWWHKSGRLKFTYRVLPEGTQSIDVFVTLTL
jgi:hypothetical protein